MASHKEILASYREILASHREILASEKEILDSHKAMLESVKSYGGIPTPAESAGGPGVGHEGVHLRKRQEMAEEKSRFEKEVQERTKTMEWYDKEFSVALDALLELFLYVPPHARDSIISKMPNSVIKKGFQRLSEK